MTSDLHPYPAYKDSGAPWLGEVPAHWRLERAKWLFRKMERPVRDDDQVVTCFRDGIVTLRKNRRISGFTESLKEIGYQGIRRGDLVIHAMDAFAGAVGVSDSDGKGTPVYSVCQPEPNVNAHFYAFLVREMARSQWIAALAKGIRERSTDFRYEGFASQVVPLPPPDEQLAIVRYLDHMDRRIRRYIRAKQKLIALLNEQKQAIIHQAVTGKVEVRRVKGEGGASTFSLCPSTFKMKPSGVEWLGEVPEHWEVKRLKWVTRLQRGYDLPADRRIPGPFPVISSGGVIDSHCEARSQGPGVVIGRYGSTDAVFFVEKDFWPHNTALFVTDFQGNRPRWCYYMLRTISKADHAGKSAVPGVDRKDLFEIMIAVPPVFEQDDVVAGIEQESVPLDTAVDHAQREIAFLREYRTRLIADVVTGKLDVRAVAAALPEEIEEPEALDESEGLADGEEAEADDPDAASEEDGV